MENAVILFFVMLPTIAAFVSDRSVGRNKTICVGAMNFAGCFPFLLEFWTEFGQQTVDNALRLIADAQTVIVIYMLAAGGYAIDKAVTGIAVSIIAQRTESRLKKIDKEQEKLVKRWGEKVTGQYQLDDYGFPVRPIPEKKKPAETDNKNQSDTQEDSED
jgi:hypothetical protein